MYGMVNQGIRTFIINNFGTEQWSTICEKAKIDRGEFILLETYPDDLTYNLVNAISEVLSLPAHAVLNAYGKYWIEYATSVGYEQLMAMFGPDYKTCLINLNHMHDHMGSFMPNIKPPRFEVKEISLNKLEVDYISTRKGLTHFVHGLFEGLGERYNTKVNIQHIGEFDAAQRFHIQIF